MQGTSRFSQRECVPARDKYVLSSRDMEGLWDGGNVTTRERRTNWSHKEPKQNSFPMSLSPGEREHTARVPPLERVMGTVWLRVALRGEEPRVVLVHGAGVSSLYGVLLAPPRTPEP